MEKNGFSDLEQRTFLLENLSDLHHFSIWLCVIFRILELDQERIPSFAAFFFCTSPHILQKASLRSVISNLQKTLKNVTGLDYKGAFCAHRYFLAERT